MKKIPIIMMLIAPYFLFGMYMAENLELLSIGLLAFGIIMLFGSVYAFFLPRMGFSGKQILFWSMLLKICNIPIFLFIFSIGLFLFVVIIQCGKEKCLSKKAVIINIVLHFIFCADVFSSIYCYIRSKKNTVR